MYVNLFITTEYFNSDSYSHLSGWQSLIRGICILHWKYKQDAMGEGDRVSVCGRIQPEPHG